MEKQKLAELVLQKIKEKKEQQQKDRPHYEVLRLEATFQMEMHDYLKSEIQYLQSLLKKENQVLKLLQQHQNQLDNTGKFFFPRIVILPDFIASEKISFQIKEFYRKTSNSFLRTDILRTKAFHESVHRQNEFLQKLNLIEELEREIRKNIDQDRKIMNQKRIKVLKQDLRLRFIEQQQKQILRTIEKQREENKDLLKQYEIKKLNLQNRKERLKYVQEQIVTYKQKIQQAFNTIMYRWHLQNVFEIQIKTQKIQKNLVQAAKKAGDIENETKFYQKKLQKAASLAVLGKKSDSPSNRKGRIQKRLNEEKTRDEEQGKRPFSQRANKEKQHRRSFSQQPIIRESLNIDITKINSTAKNSQRTTDRSSHPRYNSDLAHSLF